MELLNCRLDDATLEGWKRHFAPEVQPFFCRRRLPLPSTSRARWLNGGEVRTALSPSVHDTFATYEVTRSARHLLLLDEPTFSALPIDLRTQLLREQLEVGRGSVFRVTDLVDLLTPSEHARLAGAGADGLIVWWPRLFATLSPASQARLLSGFASEDRPPCTRHELTSGAWLNVRRVLPGVEILAGTFASESGPNCFGSVIEAFTAERRQGRTEREGFQAWLGASRPAPGDASELGTVLLWRDDQDALQHAAVSLGDGYVFHKEAQTWWSPWQVVRLAAVLERWQDAGAMTSVRLGRYE